MGGKNALMKKKSSPPYPSAKTRRKFFHLSYPFVLMLIILVIIASHYLLGKKEAKKEQTASPSIRTSIPSEEKAPNTFTEKEDEAEEENENGDEENTKDEESPWTLLKTALPPRFSQSPSKDRPARVAIILTGLGLNKAWTDKVLESFKGKISLAYSPYSPKLTEQLEQATLKGYQPMVALPMESNSYPTIDTGPYTLLTAVNSEENMRKLKNILEKTPPGTAVIGEYGGKFTKSTTDLTPILIELKNQGRIFVDPNTTIYSQVQSTCKVLNTPCFQVDLTLPLTTTTAERDDFFKKIIQNSQENGIIVISVPAIPLFISYLQEWVGILDKSGINLVMITELKNPEYSLVSPKDQGKIDVQRQDSHQPG